MQLSTFLPPVVVNIRSVIGCREALFYLLEYLRKIIYCWRAQAIFVYESSGAE